MAIHVIKYDGGSDKLSVTLCGRQGRRQIDAPHRYDSKSGEPFTAVLPNNTKLGPTCGKCRQVAALKRRGAE